jgi:hypothetical protein
MCFRAAVETWCGPYKDFGFLADKPIINTVLELVTNIVAFVQSIF